jgi:hypothetical protein
MREQKEEQQNRHVLFPISIVTFDKLRTWECFDADGGVDTARKIREYHIPDFSSWTDPESYRIAFEHLVRDLKSG